MGADAGVGIGGEAGGAMGGPGGAGFTMASILLIRAERSPPGNEMSPGVWTRTSTNSALLAVFMKGDGGDGLVDAGHTAPLQSPG